MGAISDLVSSAAGNKAADINGLNSLPTRGDLIKLISCMPEEQFRKVASYVRTLDEVDEVATSEEVETLMNKLCTRYERAFLALSK